MRDIKKYAEAGRKRVHKNNRYDIYTSEITELMEMGSKSVTDLYYAIVNAYHMGIEAGARMAAKKYKEGRC